jgi:elongation factor P
MDIENIHKNSKILIDGIPFNVVDAEFVKPGKGRAIYKLRLQNLRDGSALDRTYHSGEKVDEASITVCEEQFLYKENEQLVFMNTETFEQSSIPEKLVGDKQYYLKEGTIVQVLLLGDEPIDVTIPTFVEMKVVESAVSTKTDSITGQGKMAVMDTGLKVEVPTFVKEGDVIKVDTRTGAYVERITKTK